MFRKIDGNILSIQDHENNVVLTIEVMSAEETAVLIVSGRMTHDAAPEFEDELMAVLTTKHKAIVDFSALEYISAPALNTLLSVQKLVEKNRFEFCLRNVTGAVKETFETTGFIDLIEIC